MGEAIKKSFADNWVQLVVYLVIVVLFFARLDAKVEYMSDTVDSIKKSQEECIDQINNISGDVLILKDHDTRRQVMDKVKNK